MWQAFPKLLKEQHAWPFRPGEWLTGFQARAAAMWARPEGNARRPVASGA